MRNPVRSEAEAYRFVWLTVAYFGLIALASVTLGRWVALAVFVVLSVLVAGTMMRGRRAEPRERAVALRHDDDEVYRVLVVANETVGGELLRDAIRARIVDGRATEVLVVCPALNSKVRHWASDEDPARAAAQARLARSLARLAEDGVVARGEVGDGDPLQAIEDALRRFGADEVIVSTHPEGKSHWLERGVVTSARERFDVPIEHIVVG